MNSQIRNTIDRLKLCQRARLQDYPVYLKTNPAWLVTMAINRRAGWPESKDYFASCQPVNGQYPKRADDLHSSFRQIVDRINTPRLIVREREVPFRYRNRLQHRLTHDNDL